MHLADTLVAIGGHRVHARESREIPGKIREGKLLVIAKKISAVVAAVGVSLVGLVATTGTAQAAITQFQLCNYGKGYNAYATFTNTNFSTYVMTPGRCTTIPVWHNEPFYVTAMGYEGGYKSTKLDRVISSGRTIVLTRENFGSFYYDKGFF
ncbi:hypothetical protein [Lentzea sp. NPDC059081]|uniref:hypothetical protein n=1 Tax=Lentzea sp. NPDC059081 TaxID=3346719 RepID=UPI0036BBB3FB